MSPPEKLRQCSRLGRDTLPEVCLEGNPPGNFSPQRWLTVARLISSPEFYLLGTPAINSHSTLVAKLDGTKTVI
ncbi:hypothetical protein [Mastigocladopsis repens]|uniref:hypothetical protein n=1 Tax=Mastigocladopsis repens TaxID=221287 RepID=UPI0003064B01|nr:hypothetical protein [Mastigocladopsis repens]